MNYEAERNRHSELVDITISSKVPSKWRFVDLETGDIWRWDEGKGTFTRAKDYSATLMLLRQMRQAIGHIITTKDEAELVDRIDEILANADKEIMCG